MPSAHVETSVHVTLEVHEKRGAPCPGGDAVARRRRDARPRGEPPEQGVPRPGP